MDMPSAASQPLSAQAPAERVQPPPGLGTRLTDPAFKDRVYTVGLWVVLLGAAWSLPVLGVVENHLAHKRMESGIYYTPKMPPEYDVQRSDP